MAPTAIVLLVIVLLVVAADVVVSLIAGMPIRWWRVAVEVAIAAVLFGIYVRTRLSDPGRTDPRAGRRPADAVRVRRVSGRGM